jgi:hypothetical protein
MGPYNLIGEFQRFLWLNWNCADKDYKIVNGNELWPRKIVLAMD